MSIFFALTRRLIETCETNTCLSYTIYVTQFYNHPFMDNRECPSELREAIASIIFAAPRCSDLPDLLQIKNLITAKYGKEFVMAASELRPDSGVNRTVSGYYILKCGF